MLIASHYSLDDADVRRAYLECGGNDLVGIRLPSRDRSSAPVVARPVARGELSSSPRRRRNTMPPKIAKLAGLGAFGACAAFIALFAYVAFISRHTPTGGMMPALSAVAWISVGLVVLALIGVHILLGKQLLLPREGRASRTCDRHRRQRSLPVRCALRCPRCGGGGILRIVVQDAGSLSDVRAGARARRAVGVLDRRVRVQSRRSARSSRSAFRSCG